MSIAPRPGRIDPTVRALLRGFVSPALADRWASRLQPIAVADHRAAVTGAVSLLLDEVGVDPSDLAVALVEDVGWSSPDAGSLLGLTALEVRVALAGGGRSTPRLPRHHREPWVLRGRDTPPTTGPAGRSPAATRTTEATPDQGAQDPPGAGTRDAGTDVELRSRLPRTPPDAERRPALVLVVVLLLGLAGIAVRLGAPPAGEQDVAPVATPTPGPTPSSSGTVTPSPAPSSSPTPDAAPGDAPGDAPDPRPTPAGPVVEALRLVAVGDVLAGEGDPADVGGSFDAVDDVRVWGALDRPADEAVVVRVAVTAPDGRRSVRPVLVPAGVRSFALSLPAELGTSPGRWLVTAVLGDGEELRSEAELAPVDEPT